MKQIFLFVTSAILAALTPNFASAVDFTINVPVQIRNLHEGIETLHVGCILILATGGYIQEEITSLRINSVTGNVDATEVQVLFTINRTLHDPRDVTGYACKLEDDHDRSINPATVLFTKQNGQLNVPTKVVDETQPYRLNVSGDFPSQ